MFTYSLAIALGLDYEAGRCDDLALEWAVVEILGGRRCHDCGGPLEGWSGEHHSPQCQAPLFEQTMEQIGETWSDRHPASERSLDR